jgi:hypothetical protein
LCKDIDSDDKASIHLSSCTGNEGEDETSNSDDITSTKRNSNETTTNYLSSCTGSESEI